VNFADYGEQLSREARAIKVWTGVSYYGTGPAGGGDRSKHRPAELAQRLVRATPGLEVLAPARLPSAASGPAPPGSTTRQRSTSLISGYWSG